MNWIIERDEKGMPVMMRWNGGSAIHHVSIAEIERGRCEAINKLPMPAMREWAKKRGIE